MMGTDIYLWKLSKKGNSEAFGELYERHWQKLYTTVYWRVCDEDAAKDIVQDLFISMWDKRSVLEIRDTVEGYLKVAARNKVLNYFRAEAIKEKHNHQAELFRHDDQTNTDELLEKELDQIYGEAVKKLPEKMKEIYLLSREEYLSVDQIADRLSLSPQTVKNQLTAALKKIRYHLNSYL